MDFDAAPVIASCRHQALLVAAKLHLDVADDIAEIPVIFSKSRRVSRKCGYFQHIASDGLGRITVFEKMCRTPEYLESVLLHEFAHALVHWLRRGEPLPDGPHGRVFAYVMLAMGQEPSEYVVGASDGRAPATAFEKRCRRCRLPQKVSPEHDPSCTWHPSRRGGAR